MEIIWDKAKFAEELGTKEEFEKAMQGESAEERDEETNYVTCMRCGVKEEGDEKMVGDESYYLCENCDSDMNG
jgi:hypothetical protein